MAAPADRDRLVEYLLGDLSDVERRALEEAYFKDDELYEAVLAVENELVYDYAAGALSPVERQRFEQRFLKTAEQQARGENARALLTKIRGGGIETPAISRWWLAAAAAFLLAATGWFVADFVRQSSEGRSTIAEGPGTPAPQTPLTEPGIAPPPPRPAPAPAPQTPFVFATTLRPGLLRSGDEGARIVMPAGTTYLRLRLEISPAAVGPYSTYRITVRNAEGSQIGDRISIAPADVKRGQVLSVDVPAAPLIVGDYELVLSGARGTAEPEDLAEYYFSIVRP